MLKFVISRLKGGAWADLADTVVRLRAEAQQGRLF